MPSSRTADPVCVVGAGILGLSAAWHLVRAGAAHVTVVDAGPPLSGTTPAGAGFVAAFAADLNRRLHPAMIEVARYGLDFYADLHRSGVDIGYAANGNIVLATTEPTMDAARRGILGHPDRLPGTREVSPADIADLTGGVADPGALVGGVLMAEGAQVTTALVCQALIDQLRAAGVEFRFETPVTRVASADGVVTGVHTGDGVVPATTVVLASGAWTNDLLRPLGWSLPLVSVVATRFVTADCGLPPTMPSVQCLDLGLWLRELHGAFSWGSGRAYRGSTALRNDGVEIGVGRPSVPALIAAQHAVQPAVADVFPLLRDLAPVEVHQGMPTYSADGNFFVGELPGCRGLWTLAGDNESGVTHGPGIGRLLADLVTGADPLVDPAPLRLDRYAPEQFPDDESVIRLLAEDRIGAVLV